MDADDKRAIQDLFAPVYTEAGMALVECQRFEYGIRLMIYFLSSAGLVKFDPERAIALIEDEEKKTAGQLIQLLKKIVKVSDGMEGKLASGLVARNELIHRVITANLELMTEENGRDKLVSKIRELRMSVNSAHKAILPFVEGLAALTGMDVVRAKAEVLASLSART